MTQHKRDSQLDEKSGENNEAESHDAPERNDDAPGKHSESGYPNDDYWEDNARANPKESPADIPEPEHGYRWESTEDKQGSESEDADSESEEADSDK